ncbi:MAG: ABC transporter ATP-binding protein [Candidatus Liptonbacteria bacterium]|nr:ABC transporter ATP-binding protein [Candidatus Liptonbacteria bacterium]
MFSIQTKNLKKHFDGVYAVDDLSIKIETGQITSIIGPNGSGKTTLINTLSGLLEIDGGLVVIEESEKLSKITPHEIPSFGITRTFQNIHLFEQMTILDNILVVLTDRQVFRAIFETHQTFHLKIAEEVLTRVGLWEKRGQLAVNLSYGQRKLLEIARALAMDAKIYLLDEPFAGLFPEMVKIISGIIKELKQESKTVILIEHDMGLIRELSDYVFVLDSGKLLAEGKPSEVLAKREVIEAYLGE